MTNVPEGAQLSEDGNYWWDGYEWQLVQTVDGGTGGDAGSQGAAGFDFDEGGLRIDSVSSPVPRAAEELKAAFRVCNWGTAAGSCRVTFTIDGADTGVTWDSPELPVGGCAVPDGDGYVHGLPAQSEGEHVFEATATPAGQYAGGKAKNTINVGPAN
ncbi:MAG TPA: hypothetical protein VGQ20_01895 [Acidimicrobiales bacterium]|nr:hypothetical protein [Acidimicrobiales bacterium]